MAKPKVNGGKRPNSGPAKKILKIHLGEAKVDALRLYCKGIKPRQKPETLVYELVAKFLESEGVKGVIKHQEELRAIERSKLPPRPQSRPRKKK